MGKAPCCTKVGLKKGAWTAEEDNKLMSYIQQHGHGSWRALPTKAGLERCGKSCRLRWINYLNPDIKRGKFSLQEEKTIIQLHALLGNRWSAIASHLPQRTDNEVKNHWNTHIRKRLRKMGIDPATHKPINSALIISGQVNKDVANLSHVAQWESTRLEAEARIVRESKLSSSLSNPYLSLMNKFTSKLSPPPPPPPPPPRQRPPCLDVLRAWQATKPRKDILAAILNGGGNLNSPTSILNFPENKLMSNTLVGFNSKNPSAARTSNYGDERGKGCIMGNSLQFHDNTMDMVITNEDNLLEFPSFLEGFEDYSPAIPSNSVPFMASNTSAIAYQDSTTTTVGNEDDKGSYWSEILNVVNCPWMFPTSD